MTLSRAAQEEPTSPRTEAGRAFLDDQPSFMDGRSYRDRVILPAILAIEREAAAATPSLDGLAMAKWIRQHYVGSIDHACSECVPDGSMVIPGFVCAPHIAARLDEGSATPEQKR